MLDLTLPTLISRAIVLIISFTVHEFAHAWSADRLGDTTPRMNGRLTLNPLAHLDPLGSLMLLVAGFGWAKPVPINPYALGRRSNAGVMWVSLAGPMSNLLMAILGAALFRLGLVNLAESGQTVNNILPTPSMFVFEFILINLVLMLFNLIPLAPLDGEKIIDFFLPPSWQRAFDTIRPYGPMILLGILFLLPLIGIDVIGSVLGPPLNFLLRLLLQ